MSQTKQAMQNTIKNLQAKSEYINKLQDKGSKVLVLQLGSHTIKMGFASSNQRIPFSIRPFIAYKKSKQSKVQTKNEGDKLDMQWFKSQYNVIQQQLKAEGIISGDNKPYKGKPKTKTITSINHIQKPREDANVLYGEDAFWVQNDPSWVFRKPIQHGTLNISSEAEVGECINDIQNILAHLLKNKMKVPQKQWPLFSCVLILPDVFIRSQIKHLIHMIFTKLCFKKLYIHLQSVMVCFGTATNSACVVNVGHETISVCCVDQGIILPRTLIRKNYGMKSISKCLIKLFNQRLNSQDIDQMQINNEGDLSQADNVKQIACAIKQTQQTNNKIYEMYPIRNKTFAKAQINYNDSICIVSNSIYSQMWNAFQSSLKKQPFDHNSELYDLQPDPQDIFQQYSGGGHIYEITKQHPNYSPKLVDPFHYMSLDNMILASLASLRDCDVRKKFASSILIVGGGAHMYKLIDHTLFKLNKQLEGQNTFAEKFEIATDLILRQIQPMYSSWLGGTVIPKLDSLRDLWIERNKYIGGINMEGDDQQEQVFDKKLFTRKQQSQQWGIRYLKQKIPFLW